ncbi:TetR/AcrR family transcriptional regulator [Jongsikchunia kroppenstedtii]|uniref:TetR/AcrR family transcriptional regulator n=1 Tax=Jongsikchunia kroppenstedtii TaxID=1121721 RepID=UPI001FDEDB89|nr:TetR/AcrR family transcriptional regulator [Jongsikchunia kroppenstedtii]
MQGNSRVIAQAETRQRIKETARQRLLTQGYTPTSVAAVTEQAGFTTGAFYSNFASKAELTLEVLEELQQEVHAELTELLTSHRGSGLVDALQGWAERLLNSGLPRLELEFALSVRGDEQLVATEAGRNRAAVTRLTPLLAAVLPTGIPTPLPVEYLADLILNMVFGLAVRKIIDPRVSSDSLFESIKLLLPPERHADD